MSDKKYEFDLTGRQVEMITALIEREFELVTDMNETPSNWEELMYLASYLNFKLGFWKGREELVKVKDE